MFQFDKIKWCIGSKKEAWCPQEEPPETQNETQNQTGVSARSFVVEKISSLDGPLKNCSLVQRSPRLGYKTAWIRACIKGNKRL